MNTYSGSETLHKELVEQVKNAYSGSGLLGCPEL
jgi:hypothetical protein